MQRTLGMSFAGTNFMVKSPGSLSDLGNFKRALQNYQQVFDFIRRPSSLRFRRRSERHKRAQRSEVEIFPGISKPSNR